MKKTAVYLVLLALLFSAPASGAEKDESLAIGFYLRGAFLEARHDMERAYTYYYYAHKNDPENLDIIFALARITFDMGKFKESRDFTSLLIGSEKYDSRAWLITGEIEYREGNRDKAAEIFERIKDETEVPRFEVSKFLAKIYLEMNEPLKARGILESAKTLNPNDLFVNYRLGFIYAESGEIDRAIDSFKKAVEVNPRFSGAYLALASMYHSKGMRDDAKSSFQKAIELDPDNRSAAKDLADLYYEDMEYDKGAAVLEPFYDAGKLDEEGKITLGRFYYRQERFEDALALFKAILSTPGDRPYILRIVSEIELELGNLMTATGYLEKLIELEPDNFSNYIGLLVVAFDLAGAPSSPQEASTISDAEGRFYLKEAVKRHDRDSASDNYIIGTVYRKIGDDRRALDFLLRAEQLMPGEERTLLELASLFEDKGEFAKAIERVKLLHENDPEDYSISNFYGYLLAQQGVRLDYAEQLLEKALEAQPDNGYFLDSLGWIKYRKGDYDRALEVLLDAIEKVGDDPVIWEHLGDTYVKLNRLPAAQEAYMKSVSIDPEKPAVQGKLEKVKKAVLNGQ